MRQSLRMFAAMIVRLESGMRQSGRPSTALSLFYGSRPSKNSD